MLFGSINKNDTFTFMLTAAFATLIILPLQYAKATTYTDSLTSKTTEMMQL